MGRSHQKSCVICGTRKSKDVFLARFPLDPERCKLWVKAAGDEDLAYLPVLKLHQLKYVCGRHFTKNCFTKMATRLKRTAVPTINIDVDPLPDHILNEFPLQDKRYAVATLEPSILHTKVASPCMGETSSPMIIQLEESSCLSDSQGQASLEEAINNEDMVMATLDKDSQENQEVDEISNLEREKRWRRMTLRKRAEVVDKFVESINDRKKSKIIRVRALFKVLKQETYHAEIANHAFFLDKLLAIDSDEAFFNVSEYDKYLKPLIALLYKSKERSVRLILLVWFKKHLQLFTEDEIKVHILPEILIAMQDADRAIVRATLICLAHLVDILGTSAVIGGQARQLFVSTYVLPRIETYKPTIEETLNQSVNTRKANRKCKRKRSEHENDSANGTDNSSDVEKEVHISTEDRSTTEQDRENNSHIEQIEDNLDIFEENDEVNATIAVKKDITTSKRLQETDSQLEQIADNVDVVSVTNAVKKDTTTSKRLKKTDSDIVQIEKSVELISGNVANAVKRVTTTSKSPKETDSRVEQIAELVEQIAELVDLIDDEDDIGVKKVKGDSNMKENDKKTELKRRYVIIDKSVLKRVNRRPP